MIRPRLAILTASACSVAFLGSGRSDAATTTTTTTKTTTTTTTTTTTAATKPASASSATANAAFCTQLTASQQAIGTATGTQKQKWGKIAGEWQKIEAKAPSSLKSDVKAINTAFTKAASQDEAVGKKTLSTIAAQSKKITDFVGANCARGGGKGPGQSDGGRGGDPARQGELRACLEKAGIELPESGAEGARPNFDDPKIIAAAQKCGFGGPGGGGGRAMSDALRKCVADRGITLPARGSGGAGNGGAGNGGAGGAGAGNGGAGDAGGAGRQWFDDKTRAAIEACRAANPG